MGGGLSWITAVETGNKKIQPKRLFQVSKERVSVSVQTNLALIVSFLLDIMREISDYFLFK